MMIPVDQIPRHKGRERSEETVQAIADVREMVAKRIKTAEIVPMNLEKHMKQTGTFTDKLKRACYINTYDKDLRLVANLYPQMRRDEAGVPHWYVTAVYPEEVSGDVP